MKSQYLFHYFLNNKTVEERCTCLREHLDKAFDKLDLLMCSKFPQKLDSHSFIKD